MKQSQEEKAKKVLNYWYMQEFLSQDSFKYVNANIEDENEDTDTDAGEEDEEDNEIEADLSFIINDSDIFEKSIYRKEENEKIKKPYVYRTYTIFDISDITLQDLISKAQQDHRWADSVWGNMTFYAGSIPREDCIQYIIQKSFPDPGDSDDIQRTFHPEKATDNIACMSFQLNSDCEYIDGSLSLSPLLWTISQMEKSHGGIQDISDFRGNFSDAEHNEDDYEKQVEDYVGQYLHPGTEITLKKIQNLLNRIKRDYINNFMPAETDPSFKNIINFTFALYEDEEVQEAVESNNTNNYFGLSNGFFIDDFDWILRDLNKLAQSPYMGKDLLNYILAKDPESNTQQDRVDLLQKSNNSLKLFSEILSVDHAPLGKWPSKYMPAFMQQVAINLGIHEKKKETKSGQLFGKNGKIFSVNGPPGTGKTTMLKEIVANNVVERAKLLAGLNEADDAFEGHEIKGEHSKYIENWYSIRNDRINDYSILVASCNNAAVENISKELPKSVSDDLEPGDNDSQELAEALLEVQSVFSSSDSTNEFIPYAKNLLKEDEKNKPKKNKPKEVWGLISAALGKRQNIKKFYFSVLMPFHNDFYHRFHYKDSFLVHKKKYQKAKEDFKNQLKIVEEERNELQHVCRLLEGKDGKDEIEGKLNKIFRYSEGCQKRSKELDNIQIEISNAQKIDQSLADQISSIQEQKSKLKKRTKKFNQFFRPKVYQEAQDKIKDLETSETSIQKDKEENCSQIKDLESREKGETDDCNQLINLIKCDLGMTSSIPDIKSLIDELNNERLTLTREYEDICNKIKIIKEKNEKADDFHRMTLLDEEFINDIFSSDINRSTKAHVKNPWFTEEYNRNREKLFYYAMTLHREFVLSSKHCQDNLHLLAEYWGLGTDHMKFKQSEIKQMVPALFQTLSLLVPVVSTTFASVGNMLRDVKTPGTFGTLIIDEAGQAEPQMALGALYRSRKAIIVGDPKQIEPVVTDELDILKEAYTGDALKAYKSKTISVQEFADILNRFGTDLDEEWVGCPLLVHRRCISPMFDISNRLSYAGIMKQQTPNCKKDILPSKWINIPGNEVSERGNHFVEQQGEIVCELLEQAFEEFLKQKAEDPDNEKEGPPVFIISPFKTVAKGIRHYIEQYCAENPDSKIDVDYMNQGRIGTVHTFQGKETDEVIFLLGCDRHSTGAVCWVKKNIVNVAVSRAKLLLYIIGDESVWNESECVSFAKEILDSYYEKKLCDDHDADKSQDD